MWYIYTMDYYSDIKRNGIGSFVVMWMNLESIIQSKVSQKEQYILYVKADMESRKMVQVNLFAGQGWTCIYRELKCGHREGQGKSGTNCERSIDTHTHTHTHTHRAMCEIASQWDAAVYHRELNSVLCDDLEGWEVGVGRETSEEGVYVYM